MPSCESQVIAPQSRLRAMVLALCLALGVALVTVAAGAAPARAEEVQPVPIRVVSQNVQYNLSLSDWVGDVRKVTTLADVAGIQEASDRTRRNAMVTMLHNKGWQSWFPDPGGYSNPIIWNASLFSLVSTRSIMTHGGEAGVTPPRYINTAVLRHKPTGQLFVLINTHAISQGARDGGRTVNERTDRLKKHIAMLRDEILRTQGTTPNVVVTGDLNVNYLLDRHYQIEGLPTATLGDIVNFDMPLEPSWGGNALFDYVMSAKAARLSFVSSRMVRDVASDHAGVLVNYTMPPKLYSTTRFSPGTVTNVPGTSKQRMAIGVLVRAINATGPGEAIHVVSRYVQDLPVHEALIRAHQRGAHVQVVFTAPSLNDRARQLIRLFGTNKAARTFAVGCSSACQVAASKMAPTELLISQAGTSRAFLTRMTQPASRLAVINKTTSTITGDLATYNASFERFFELVGR